MKVIPKAQYGTRFIAQSDNTRVTRPVIVEKKEYKPKPNEFFFTDNRTGRKILMRKRDETVSADNSSPYQRQEAQRRAEQAYKQYEEDKRQKEGMTNLQGLFTLASPSTYIGPIFNNNGKSYIDNVMSGQGTGDTGANLAIDLLTPKVGQLLYRFPKFVGKKYAAPYLSSRILNNSIKANPKGQILVSDSYFNSPYNWYRITESPEVYGIKEIGKNVTTRDAADMYIPSNNFRLDVINNRLTSRDGYWYKPLKSGLNLSKRGDAHGNTSQAAKGYLWQGTTSHSKKFPRTVLEGDIPVQVYTGFDPIIGAKSRTSFHLVDSETIPMGARIGFHTGEMPIEGLRSFTKLSNGQYRYNGPVIPYKTIQINK